MGAPVIRIFEWDIDEPSSPVGIRNIAGGVGFVQMVASGCTTSSSSAPATTSGTLIFKGTKFNITDGIGPSHLASKVTALTVNLGSSGTAISDMRVFLRDDSALLPSTWEGLDPAIVQGVASGVWVYKAVLASGAAPQITTAVPAFPNLFRQDGTPGLLTQDDQNSSQFLYMNIVIPNGFPLGSYGICGSGSLRFGLMFSYFPLDLDEFS